MPIVVVPEVMVDEAPLEDCCWLVPVCDCDSEPEDELTVWDWLEVWLVLRANVVALVLVLWLEEPGVEVAVLA